jgi:hypothetical protein
MGGERKRERERGREGKREEGEEVAASRTLGRSLKGDQSSAELE